MSRRRFALVCGVAMTAFVHVAIGAPARMRFDRSVLLEETAATSANVSIGDLNGDGKLDLVLAKGRHWPLASRVLLNDGHANFTVQHDLANEPRRSYSARLADLDADGDLDTVLSNDEPDPKQIYLNDGRGNFTIGGSFGDPAWPTRNVEVADVNNDSAPDIVVANRSDGDGANFICLNRGDGTFAACAPFSHEPATTIAAVDLNRDGQVDLIVPHRDGGQSFAYLNTGGARFDRRIAFGPADAHFRMAFAADMDGGGLPDIVALDERRGVFVFTQENSGQFSTERAVDGAATDYALLLADLDGDGHSDILVGRTGAPSTVYFNIGSNGALTPVSFGDGKGTVYGFAVGDLDGDGIADIAVARSDAPNAVYFGAR